MVKVGANGEVETVEQEKGEEAHAEVEEELEEVGSQLLEEEEEEDVGEALNDDSNWGKDPEYQPPSGVVKKAKKVMSNLRFWKRVEIVQCSLTEPAARPG